MITIKQIVETHSISDESYEIKWNLKKLKLLADLIVLNPSSKECLAEMSGISSSDVILKILKGNGKEVSNRDLKNIANFMGLEDGIFKVGHLFYFYDGRYRNKIKEMIPRIFKNGAYYLHSRDFVYINNGYSSIVVNAKSDFVEDVLRPIANIHPGKLNPHFVSEGKFNSKEMNNYFKGNDFDLFATWSDLEDMAIKARVELKDVMTFIRKSNSSTENSELEKSRLAFLAIEDMTRTGISLRSSASPQY